MLRYLLLLTLLLTTPLLAQDYEFLGDYRSHSAQGHRLVVQTSNRPLTLESFQGGTIRVTVGASEAAEAGELASATWTVKEQGERLEASFSGGTVTIQKQPVRLTFTRPDGSVAVTDDPAFGHGWSGNEVRTWKVLGKESFYGLGEKSGNVNKRGRFWTNWNSDIPAYRDDTDPLYCGIPFFSGMVGSRAFGIYFPNSYRSTFNLGAGNRRLYSFGAEGGALSYYVFLGPGMKEVLAQYTDVVGRMALPPKWALGYQQCRWSYTPEYEIRDLAREFRQRKIPADVLYFDIHYMDAYKVFTWHPKRFSQPQRLLADLKSQGFKTVTIIDPGVKVEKGYEVYEEGVKGDHFLKFLDGSLFEGEVWPGWCHFPNFAQARTRAWWGSHTAKMRKMGVDGFWNDMNEPALWGKEMPFVVERIKSLHNKFALLMAQATYEGLLADKPDLRPFIVTRAGWAGIQRYAAVWTGDNSASYDDLALSIRTNLGLGLSGVPFVGCDVGGFIGRPDSELYVRWMQAASFSPFMRSHTVVDSPDQEPWSFGEASEELCRQAISLRYALLPYLYSELHRAHETGVPLYRPVWLEFPEDTTCRSSDSQHQFMIGESMLVAPVLRQGQRFQKVYLPEGRWYEPGRGKFHQGPGSVLVEAPLSYLPRFYREGAIIPTREVQQYVDEVPLETLKLTVVPGKAGRYVLFLDDGVSLNGPRDTITFEYDGEKQLRWSWTQGPWSSQLRAIRVFVAGQRDYGTVPREVGSFRW